VLKAVPLENEDLLAFTAARFDYMLANPQVNRLATWRTVERAEPTETERESFQERVASVAAAQQAGGFVPTSPPWTCSPASCASPTAGSAPRSRSGRRAETHVDPAPAGTSSGTAGRGPQRHRAGGLK
jgi:hypothetical protein